MLHPNGSILTNSRTNPAADEDKQKRNSSTKKTETLKRILLSYPFEIQEGVSVTDSFTGFVKHTLLYLFFLFCKWWDTPNFKHWTRAVIDGQRREVGRRTDYSSLLWLRARSSSLPVDELGGFGGRTRRFWRWTNRKKNFWEKMEWSNNLLHVLLRISTRRFFRSLSEKYALFYNVFGFW